MFSAELFILNFGIFFDGTCNNLWNTEARFFFNIYKNGNSQYKQFSKADDTSYENDYTNIARFYNCRIDDDYAIYIEGSGTTSTKDSTGKITYGEDDSAGLGFGQGSSGIRGKVRKVCEILADRIAQQYVFVETEALSTIVLDVYGFSRGAAAARNFIYEVLNPYGIETLSKNVDSQNYVESCIHHKKTTVPPHGFLGYYLKERNVDMRYGLKIEIRFAGLFDTVSSYEPRGSAGTTGAVASHNFDNDTKDLHLNFLDRAKYVLHLTSSDEHRENFSLTTIDSTLSRKNNSAIEILMPGVHSDIGGSYNDAANEKSEVLDVGVVSAKSTYGFNFNLYDKANRRQMRQDCEQLIAQGWFRKCELLTNIDADPFYELKFLRKQLSNRYSFIPLTLMCRYMENWKINYNSSMNTDKEILVVNANEISKNYSLPTGLPQNWDLFSMNGNVISFKAGGIECKIFKEDNLLGQTIKDICWVAEIKGVQFNMRYSTWVDCVDYLIR